MGLIMDSSVVEGLCVLLALAWVFYNYLTKDYGYWRVRGVPHEDAVFPLGSLTDMMLGRAHIGEAYDRLYRKFKGERYFGIIDGRNPTLVIRDPDLIKHVLTKDFRHFSDRAFFPETAKKEYILNHLFSLDGQRWRRMRLILTPTFTSGKMKAMFTLMEKCSTQLQEHMDKQTNSEVDIKDTLVRFTMDIIATCAFGLDINSLSMGEDCEFYRLGIKIFKPNILKTLSILYHLMTPFLARIYPTSLVPPDTTEFLTRVVRDTIAYREKRSVVRNDFLDLLIRIRQNKSVDDEVQSTGQSEIDSKQSDNGTGITIEDITAQVFIFFAAGFETASSTASFCLYELARHPEVQERLFQEIYKVLAKHGGQPTYQAIQEMTYMGQVVNETLRLYASVSVLVRSCTERYQIPDSKLVIEKGTKMHIPVFSIHHDPEYYPEPEKFDPERFSVESVKERHPYLHLPFGEGPRMCIGMRFGLMQTKVALTTMVYNYQFKLAPGIEVPIRLNKRSPITMPERPVFLRVTRRNTVA